MARCHVTFLELHTSFLSLIFFNPPQGSHIRLMLDNLTQVGCLMRGGSRSPLLSSHGVDHKLTSPSGLDPLSQPPVRRHSGLPVAQGTSLNRMDSGRHVVQQNLVPMSTSRSGPLRDQCESPSSELCIPSLRPESSGSGRLSPGLEQVENNFFTCFH